MKPEIGFSKAVHTVDATSWYWPISILIHGHVPVPGAAVCHSVNDKELV